MYALDSDTYSRFLQGKAKVTARILMTPRSSLWLPAIVVEEQVRGRLAVLAGLNSSRSGDSRRTPQAYAVFLKTLGDLQSFQFLHYTAETETLYQSWPFAIKRLGTRDCRIVATAMVHGFTVVTCNLSHFLPIPGIIAEDWSE